MTQSATQKFYKSKFTKKNIAKIDKITVRYGNPLAQTTSGRLQIAETLMQNGLLTAQQYFQVIETGNSGRRTPGPRKSVAPHQRRKRGVDARRGAAGYLG
jgi:hypothetical protein